MEERYDTSGSTDSMSFTETFHNLKVSSKTLRSVDTGRSLCNHMSAVPTEEKQPIPQDKNRYGSSRKCVASAHIQANVW